MKGWLSVILSLFLAFGVTAAALAHAAEPGLVASALSSMDSCGGYTKKSEKGQSDPAKMSVPFHGCHAHDMGIPGFTAPAPERITPVRIMPAGSGTGLPPPARSDTFRPPIA